MVGPYQRMQHSSSRSRMNEANRHRPEMRFSIIHELERPDRTDTPAPQANPPPRFLAFRGRIHKVGRGFIHEHSGHGRRESTCPNNATCVGIDDIDKNPTTEQTSQELGDGQTDGVPKHVLGPTQPQFRYCKRDYVRELLERSGGLVQGECGTSVVMSRLALVGALQQFTQLWNQPLND